MMRGGLAIATLVLAHAPATADIVDRSAAGFEVHEEVTVAAPAAVVYRELLTPAHWWNPDHTYSGDAARLSIDMERGCFCERLADGGSVRHMQVIYADGRRLVLEGALGPLATTGATGHLTFTLTAAAPGTRVALTYAVGGYARGGLAERWAAPVDGVLKEQLERLKAELDGSQRHSSK